MSILRYPTQVMRLQQVLCKCLVSNFCRNCSAPTSGLGRLLTVEAARANARAFYAVLNYLTLLAYSTPSPSTPLKLFQIQQHRDDNIVALAILLNYAIQVVSSFLDLTIKLRYTVYEQIKISARRYRLKYQNLKYKCDDGATLG
jgi:hypothetical protein